MSFPLILFPKDVYYALLDKITTVYMNNGAASKLFRYHGKDLNSIHSDILQSGVINHQRFKLYQNIFLLKQFVYKTREHHQFHSITNVLLFGDNNQRDAWLPLIPFIEFWEKKSHFDGILIDNITQVKKALKLFIDKRVTQRYLFTYQGGKFTGRLAILNRLKLDLISRGPKWRHELVLSKYKYFAFKNIKKNFMVLKCVYYK